MYDECFLEILTFFLGIQSSFKYRYDTITLFFDIEWSSANDTNILQLKFSILSVKPGV